MSTQNLPANLFAGIIAQAATTLPEKSGTVDRLAMGRQRKTEIERTEYERIQARLSRAGIESLLILDASGSMSESAGDGRTKMQTLSDALTGVLADLTAARSTPRMIVFSASAQEITGLHALPAPSGGTAMHRAIERAANICPRSTLVFSDGLPDDEDAAIRAAEAVSGTIDVIYCGPDNDKAAIAFMRRLASVGGGRVHVHNLRRDADGTSGRAIAATVKSVLMIEAGRGKA